MWGLEILRQQRGASWRCRGRGQLGLSYFTSAHKDSKNTLYCYQRGLDKENEEGIQKDLKKFDKVNFDF